MFFLLRGGGEGVVITRPRSRVGGGDLFKKWKLNEEYVAISFFKNRYVKPPVKDDFQSVLRSLSTLP